MISYILLLICSLLKVKYHHLLNLIKDDFKTKKKIKLFIFKIFPCVKNDAPEDKLRNSIIITYNLIDFKYL